MHRVGESLSLSFGRLAAHGCRIYDLQLSLVMAPGSAGRQVARSHLDGRSNVGSMRHSPIIILRRNLYEMPGRSMASTGQPGSVNPPEGTYRHELCSSSVLQDTLAF